MLSDIPHPGHTPPRRGVYGEGFDARQTEHRVDVAEIMLPADVRGTFVYVRSNCAYGAIFLQTIDPTHIRPLPDRSNRPSSMPLPPYEYKGAVDHTVKPAIDRAAGKSVIVTGGANGIGESCVRHFVDAGAFVTFADLNERGTTIEKELNSGVRRCQFVKCDIRSWDDQKAVFEAAKSQSPSQSVDIVIANAGISRSSGDSLWQLDGELQQSASC